MIKKVLPVLLCLSLFISCTDKQTKKEIAKHADAAAFNTYVKNLQKEADKKIEDYVNSLTLEEKISQLFIENLEGCKSFRSYETVGDMNGTNDKTPLVAGGYLYFTYNIAETRQLQKDFNNSIKEYCKQYNVIPPYLAVDQEGGYVNRLKKLNTKLPSNQKVAQEYSINEAYELYSSQAQQMVDLGFHMNLAPVIEVCTKNNEDFLDGRSFGELKQVLDYGTACIHGYENNGVATVVKHFPGNTNTDPHTGLPEITLPEEELMESIKSFEKLLDYNPKAILMSHARTSAIDPGVPACLSKVWITDILRNQFKYKGIIFSDDIFMGALADNGYPPEVAAVKAIEAGVDCIMISEKRFAKAARVLYKTAKENPEFAQRINDSVKRIVSYKVNAGIININQD